jgi:transcriptional regulator with XRE-family HTH domain
VPERPAPSVRARQLARELRRLREAAQLTGEAAAARLGWSSAKVSRIETARTPITVSDLRKLLGLYGAIDTDADRLVDLARTSRERGWWDSYVGEAPSEFATFLGLEAEASSISSFNALVMPGLLQTEDYARAMLRSLLLMPPREVERLVEIRRIRQGRIYQADKTPLILHVVLDESTLRRQIGGPDVLRDQLKHLVSVATDLNNVKIQVLPYSAGAHPAVAGTFAILAFPRSGDLEIVSVELLDSHLFVEGEKEVYRYTLVFNELISSAFDSADSLTFIKQAIRDL